MTMHFISKAIHKNVNKKLNVDSKTVFNESVLDHTNHIFYISICVILI